MFIERAQQQVEPIIIKIDNLLDLGNKLLEHGVDWYLWGKEGTTKNLMALYKELKREDPFATVFRGLKEEMKIKRKKLKGPDLEGLIYLSSSPEERESRGFPGLRTVYSYHDFIFELPERFYKPEGYIVKESGFKTRLVWEKIV